jgi:hypothetical protein
MYVERGPAGGVSNRKYWPPSFGLRRLGDELNDTITLALYLLLLDIQSH